MKKSIFYFLFFLVCCKNITAQDPAYPASPPVLLNLDHAEYFISSNTLFGGGNFIALPAGIDVSANPSINTAALAPGSYQLYVRAINSEGKWSLTLVKTFTVLFNGDPAYPSSPAAPGPVISAEYFFDSNPLFGNGTTVPGLPNTQVDINNFNFSAAASSLPVGDHNFYIRSLDDWSITAQKTFSVINPFVPNDICAYATDLLVGDNSCTAQVVNVNTAQATSSAGIPAPSCDVTVAPKDVWFKVTSFKTGLLSIETSNNTGTVILQVFTGNCGSLNQVVCSSTGTINTFNATLNTTYYLRAFISNGTGSFDVKAYQPPVAGSIDFENSPYYTASGNSVISANQTLAAFDYSAAPPLHPLLNDGVYFPITNLLNENLWLRVRHIASDPNGTNVGYNVSATQNSPFRTGGFGGWFGFLYQFDIYKDVNLPSGCRTNTLNGLTPTNIVMESIETLSGGEWLMFETLNPESSNWVLSSVNFTGNNPGSNPGFSSVNIPYPAILPGGFSPAFPAASKNIYAIDLGGGSYAEFKMKADNVSQFKYGYEYQSPGGYQGIRLSFGTVAVLLPVSLISFNASLQNINNARLQWQIATAEDGSKYELQRSTDGRSFLPINLQTGNATLTQFGYTDNALPNGTYYYRLKMTDKDGKVSYSNIAIVKVGSKEQLIVAYPNPIKRGESLQLSLQNIIANKIEIVSALGQVVYSNATKQTGSIGISISSSLMPGLYLVRIVSDNKVDVEKLLIQ